MSYVSARGVAAKVAQVDQFFAEDVARFKQRLAELSSRIEDSAEPQRQDRFHRQAEELLAESYEACRQFEAEHGDDPVLIRDVQQGFRAETAPWFDRSWIAHRARSKPSGFAGDYEMLIKLYEQRTPARGLGGYLDLCILDLPLARAVRARLAAARTFLVDEVAVRPNGTRILDIACGPCFEYVDWPASLAAKGAEVVAMDNDPKALEYLNACAGVVFQPGLRILPTRYNALRTRASNATIRNFGRFDIIYSVGLFDYLPDEQLIPILQGLRETLNGGGRLYISFKDSERYDKTPYQWHLDWFFYQRDVSDFLRLFRGAGIEASALEMTRDSTGIIVNFATRREAARYLRTDAGLMHGAAPAMNAAVPHDLTERE